MPERRVFGGISEHSAYNAMTRACRNAKVPHYSPHSTSDTGESRSGISPVCRRGSSPSARGTREPSMSLDVYCHVMPPDEVSVDSEELHRQ